MGEDSCKDIASEENLVIKDFKNNMKYVSQCQPIIGSIRTMNFEKKQDIESRAEMLVTNFFDKELIEKRSIDS